MGKLKREVERAKRTLSSQTSVRMEIESFFEGKDLSETLTRAKFEEVRISLDSAVTARVDPDAQLNADLFRKTLKPVEQVLKDANVKKDVRNRPSST